MLLPRTLVLAVPLALLVGGAPARAHSQDAALSGVVRDASGVSVPDVEVTVTSQTTGASQTTKTAGDGGFSLSLAPGDYRVAVALTGFRRIAQDVQVRAEEPQRLEIVLQPVVTEEVTVTAMKRETTMLETPFSVAAPTEEVLRERGVTNLEGIAATVGGFTVQNLGPGQSQIAMRGVSAGQIVRDQPGVKEQVGVYLDESVVSLSLFTPDLDLFDMERVEVLRGPQGTLFGSGSLSGTVRYITRQPELGVTNGSVELDGLGVGGGGLGGNIKAAFNVPLGDTSALRIASYVDRLPGYIDAVQPGRGLSENVNDGLRTGVRAAVRLVPNSRLSVTPRLVYQRVETDGWNRTDAFNILANPFTTTRPAVTLGAREQYVQLQEDFTDDFVLGDVNLTYDFGGIALTSITSYTYRDVLVVRDATALTGSITGGSIGLPEAAYALDAPLNDATTAHLWTQELRLSGGRDRWRWVGGGFFSHMDREYRQDLPVPGFEEISGVPTQGLRAPQNTLFFSDLGYNLRQFALFGEGTLELTEAFSLTGGLRYYRFSEDKEQVFDGIFGNDNTGTSLVSQPGTTEADGVAPRLIATYKLSERTNVNAQVARGFRLGGINDPLNVPLCTPQDLVTFGGRETWDDETAWNYEVGVKSRVLDGKGAFNISGFYMDIRDLQATVTAGSCSSRVIFNVPKARSQGLEMEFEAAPNRNLDFALSATFTDPELRSTLTSTDPSGAVSVVSGIEAGRRLPTVPRVQVAAAATYQWDVRRDAVGYVTASFQHIGTRFTQVGDEDLGTLNLLSFGANTIGGPLTASVFTYNPELPAYDLLNLRAGVRRNSWDVSVYVNNVTDERALLSLDHERGTRARISYLTNQPRTFGIANRFTF